MNNSTHTKPKHISDCINNVLKTWNQQEPFSSNDEQSNQVVELTQLDVGGGVHVED